MIKEFKEFITRGNVMDLAVGVIIGAAFSAIVNSLVNDIISPIIVALTQKSSVEELTTQIGTATLHYGLFLQSIIDFLIVALVLFAVIKAANTFRRKHPEADQVEAEIPVAEQYLMEIRDLLASQNSKPEDIDHTNL
ncbi:large conductance mechanosensitive channel protein MscL [Jeotgalibaca sp. MA1X17-3]|uniref:large conductance mechanosensitive channel protein MscL n=1 Tax=Jeotgalibaca sp. MA1X17-3 TaxID=2908211 RepID=UPI001F3E0CB6|nr:large conductance mechanosensitive channel protein MscL [Jeotgalibaca sp. MA1X17-3]UJF15887.1 large conductance mechanosensitive channel protein MscL [Jeotgalibaca sp. MA1X17-3]